MRDGEPVNCDNVRLTFEELFPEAICLSAMRELSAWTSVYDIAAAARCLAGTPGPTDQFETSLILPFADSDEMQTILIKAFEWLIKAYRVPLPKLLIAAEIEPCLNAERRDALREALFKPKISVGGPSDLTFPAPSHARHKNVRYFFIEDQAHIIEMLQAPLRCLMVILTKSYDNAHKMRDLKKQSLETSGGAPSIYHRPYADSQMPAILDALCFYGFGMDFGPSWSMHGRSGMVQAYRAVNVQARPPVEISELDVARTFTAKMLESLT